MVGVVVFVCLLAAGVAATVALACAWSPRDPRRVGAALPLFAVGLLLFYSLYLGALWFDTRYLAPVNAAAALLVAIVGAAAWRYRRRTAEIGVGLLLAALLAAVIVDTRYLVRTPAATVDTGYDGAKGYREVAAEIIAAAPPGAVVGSLQSGALSYYGGDRIRVVNLDGVVDSGAARALADRRLTAYASSQGVGYFADWPYNLGVLLSASSDPQVRASDFHPVHAAAPQGSDSFTLWRIDWAVHRRTADAGARTAE